ncbi:hypothetical protein TNCV_1909251 [Trichonephila clavipes]|nr:hypothetical protein TNCV_1909251 [Trichonephila clavipes]
MERVLLAWKCILVSLEGKQTAMRYLAIPADQVHPVMLIFHPYGDGYVIDDTVLEVFKIGSLNISVISNTFPGHRIAQILAP